MDTTQENLARLRRPRLLISAARFGLADYDRSRDLRRIFRASAAPGPAAALARLIDEEADLEATRRAGGATYSIARHVDVLIALMGEAQSLRQPENAG